MKKDVILRACLMSLLLAAIAAVVVDRRVARGRFRAIVRQPDTSRMVYLKGDHFVMGSTSAAKDHSGADEHPAHLVKLSPFYLDVSEVTNSEFAAFIAATGYQTDAEKKGASWVFKEGLEDWKLIEGADWKHPLGPDSNIVQLMDHPVVHVSWNDANTFAKWAGKRLPTEAEWEYAARDGRDGELYPWGDHLMPKGKPLANFWQGTWPNANTLQDGHYYSAPARSFPPTDFGLYDMIGNVWEWTADWYAADYYRDSPALNPKGPGTGEMRVARGGSWFCAANYCGAYRVGFRGKTPPDDSFNNLGFRCAKDSTGTK
jgi:formylglycine-generating enzyme required for sulfatase activity